MKNHSSDKSPAKANPRASRGTRRILNTRLLVITLITAVVFGAGAYFWRGYQFRQAAGALLDRAEQLRDEEEYRQAADYLSRYVRLRPGDGAAQVLLAKTYDEATADSSNKSRAVELYAQAMGAVDREADRRPLRRRLAELELAMRNFAAAREQAERVLAQTPEDATAARVKAMAMYGQYQLETLPTDEVSRVVPAVRQALDANPRDLELATLLANIYRRRTRLLDDSMANASATERAQQADAVVDQAVAANERSVESLLTRHRYREQYELPGAEDDLLAALEKDPEHPAVLLAATRYNARLAIGLADVTGKAAQAQSRYERAIDYGRRAAEAMPGNEQAYLLMADLHLAHDNPQQALQVCHDAAAQGSQLSIRLLCRKAAALLALDQADEAEEALNGAAESLSQLDPRISESARQRLQLTYALVRARWLMQRGESAAVVELLEPLHVAESASVAENQHYRLLVLLGQAHSDLGQSREAARIFTEAAERRPGVVPVRLLAANAWEEAGDQDRAQLERRLAQQADGFETWLLADVQRELQRQAARSTAERDWTEVDRLLSLGADAKAQGELDEPWRLALIRLSYQQLRDEQQMSGARILDRLAGLEEEYADSPELFQQLVPLYTDMDAPEQADQALARLKELTGGEPATVVTEARLLTVRGQHQQALAMLRDQLKDGDAEQPPAILRALASVERQQGRLEKAREHLLQLHSQDPESTAVVHRLAEIALSLAARTETEESGGENKDQASWLAECRRWEKTLKDIEGESGHLWRFHRARRLMQQAEQTGDARVDEATQLVSDILETRPDWAPALLLQGDLLNRGGEPEEAVAAYRAAIKAGASGLNVYESLVSLLFQLGHHEEVDELLGELQQGRRQLSGRLQSLQMVRAGMRGDETTLLELARRAVEQHPEDSQARLQLGWAIFVGGGEPAEAIEQMQAALERAKDPAQRAKAYQLAILLHLRTDQPAGARTLIERMLLDEQLPEKQRRLTAATAYQSLGDREKAADQYRQAVAAAPNDPDVQLQFARFLLQSDFQQNADQAEEILRMTLKDHPENHAARRMLASLLAGLGGESQWAEAERLLVQGGDESRVVAEDRRLQALLLARRGGAENRGKAREILNQRIDQAAEPAPGDRLLLAQLQLADGQVVAAGQQYQALAEREDAQPEHIARYAQFLFSQRQFDEAEPWLRKLEELAPERWETVALRSQWLNEKGRGEEAVELIEPLAKQRLAEAEEPARQAALAAQIANLYRQLELNDQAVAWYERAVEPAEPRQEHLVRYIDLLLETEQLDEAAAQLQRLEQQAPGELPTVARRARWLKATGEESRLEPLIEQAAQQWIEQRRDEPQGEARVALTVGRLYSELDQPELAQRWYDQLRQLAPDQYAPLAMSLARQEQLDDAIQLCLEAAEGGSSSRPAQTLASVLLEGEPTEEQVARAAPLLKKAAEEHPENPRLKTAVAAVWVDQDRPAEAIKLYEMMIQEQPENVVALNNLATCLGEIEGRGDEALEYIDRAIRIAGPRPMLLDTKGTILLARDEVDEAVRLLEQATDGADPDPRYRLHLAEAYRRVGQKEKARQSLQNALQGHLHRYVLTATDARLLRDLEQNLQPTSEEM